jgi:hypothetical protein
VPIILQLNYTKHLLSHDIDLLGRLKYSTFLEFALLPYLGLYLTVSNFGFPSSLLSSPLKLTTRFGIYLQDTTKLRKPKVNLYTDHGNKGTILDIHQQTC